MGEISSQEQVTFVNDNDRFGVLSCICLPIGLKGVVVHPLEIDPRTGLAELGLELLLVQIDKLLAYDNEIDGDFASV